MTRPIWESRLWVHDLDAKIRALDMVEEPVIGRFPAVAETDFRLPPLFDEPVATHQLVRPAGPKSPCHCARRHAPRFRARAAANSGQRPGKPQRLNRKVEACLVQALWPASCRLIVNGVDGLAHCQAVCLFDDPQGCHIEIAAPFADEFGEALIDPRILAGVLCARRAAIDRERRPAT